MKEIHYRNIFYRSDDFSLINKNCLVALKNIEAKSVDMIFADPPYFLSNNGITVSSGKQVSVNKADWDMGYDFKKNINLTENGLKHVKECFLMMGLFGYLALFITFIQ